MGRNISTKSSAYLIIIVLVASFAVYFNTLLNGFVYDDIFQVVKNPWITDVKYIPDFFLTKTWGYTGIGPSNYYRPMMHLVYMFDYHVFGLEPWGFHLVNILLHACVSVLVFLIAARLAAEAEKGWGNLSDFPLFSRDRLLNEIGGDRQEAIGAVHGSLSFALIAALLFAVHPVHTEAVAWVAGLPELAFTFFYLLSFYFFTWSGPEMKSFYLLSVASFLISTLFKETALTLPIIFLAYDHVSGRTAGLSAYVRKYLPYFAVAGIYFIMRVHALGGLAPENAHAAMSVYQYVINVFPLFGEYLAKLIFPINLSALYVFRPIFSLFSVKGFVSLMVTVAFCLLIIRAKRRDRIVFLSLLLIAVPLLPAFYIPAIAQPFAERYLYLPSIGFALILSLALTRLKAALKNKALGVTATVLILVLMGGYAAATVERNAVWRNSYSLWKDTVKKTQDSFIAHLGLGNALLEDEGRVDDAIVQYQAAMELSPRNPDIHDNLGFAFFKKGWIGKAMEQYRVALALNPRHADARANLGLALSKLGRTEEAMEQYRLAIASDPTFADPHDYLGAVYQRIGETDWAIREYEAAVKLDPSNAAFRRDLSRARGLTGGTKGTGK
jgi:protein O-mannosyl-transferase